jgi:uncharacterized membrane protein
MKRPWMHIKLTLVVLSCSGPTACSVKLARYRKGKQTGALPAFVAPLAIAALSAILVLAVARPLG